jgi:hypothetical protein
MKNSRHPARRRSVHWSILALVTLFLGTGLWLVFASHKTRQATAADEQPPTTAAATRTTPAPVRTTSKAGGGAVPPQATTDTFRKWLGEFNALTNAAPDDPRRAALLNTGLALAEQRRAHLTRLIRENPKQALAEALRFDEYDALPEAIRSRVERPFSERAGYMYLPICGGADGKATAVAADHLAELSLPDGTRAEAFTYGQRAGITSKRSLPAAGIVLDGVAALQDGVFRSVLPEERATVLAKFPFGQADATRSFATGQAVSGAGVLALAGGQIYVFASTAELQTLDTALAALDDKPGPNSGSSILFSLVLPSGAGGGFNLSGAKILADQLASAWTETRKKVFLIRVDFSDHAGEPVTQAAAATEMNGASSAMILAMSYGKTWVEAAASANLYRLPQTAAYYTSGSLNSELLRDARNTFRNTRSGADAAINIGPVSNTGSGGDSGLGDYDIVGVFFGSINMGSGSLIYAGLASVGGGDLWVQDANYTSLYTHEWGHNYGLGHASFWQTSDGSVVGAGANEEYGDPFDVMGSGPAGRGHYHPQGKARLNWLATNEWADATASGSAKYRVYRIDDAGTTNSPRGLRVTKSATPGNEEYYWVGYRPGYEENPHLRRGAYLIWQRPAEVRCWLVDTTPGSADGKNDSSVDLGRTYSDTNAHIHITPVAVGGSGSAEYLDVRVNLGTFPGNHAPTISGLTGNTTVVARSNYTYSVTATDSDGDSLAFWWNGQDGSVNNSSNTISHSWTVGGTYSLGVTVSDMKGGTVTTNVTIVVNDPLDTWTSANAGTTATIEDVLWAKGRCVAADYFGRAYLSWDGATWENEGALPGFEAYVSYRPQFAFGNNTFVVVGKALGTSAAQIGYSLDGRTWREASFPAGVPQTKDVAYGNGQFVAVGDGGTVMRSTNGIDWTFATVPGAPEFRFLTFDGTTWLAIALNASAYAERLWTSPDGVNWTQQSLLGNQVFDIFAIGDTAYAVGWYGGLKYSTDHGLTWQSALLPGTTSWSTYSLAAADDGTMLLTARAMDEGGTPYALLVSTDGRTWSRSSGNADVASASEALAFGSGRFISGGSNGGIRQSATLHPNNQAPAASFTSAPSTGNARQSIYFAANATDSDGDTPIYAWDFGSETTILDGFEIAPIFSFGGGYTCVLRVSDNHGGLTLLTNTVTLTDPARTWTQRTSGTSADLMTVAASASTLVAVGANGTVLTSTNGSAWTSRSLPDYSGNIYLDGAAWDGARFHIVGDDYDFGISAWVAVIYSSPDGVTWTRRYKSTSGGGLHAAASSGSASVAVGNSGTVLRTTDGTNWSSVSVPGLGTPTVSGVAYGGGVFTLVAYTGGNGTPQVFTSSDGLSWLDYSSGAGLVSWQDLRKVAWLNDRFAASGFHSKLRVSTDGGQTFTTTRSHTEDTPALAGGDGFWFAAGIDHDASDAAVDVMSLDGTDWLSFAAPTSTQRNGAAFFNHTFITVGASGSIWQSGVVSPFNGWPSWQLAHFPAGSVISLPGRNADNDLLLNIAEYALGRDPNSSSGANGTSALPQGIIASGRGWLRLDLPEPAVADVNYVVQGSTNLTTVGWSDLARKNGVNAWQWLGGGPARINSGTPAGGRVQVDVGAPDSASALPMYYFRLQLEQP